MYAWEKKKLETRYEGREWVKVNILCYSKIQPRVKWCRHHLSLRRKIYCRNHLFMTSSFPYPKSYERAMQHLCCWIYHKRALLYAAEGCWHQFLQVSSCGELQEAKWMQSREAPNPCISMALEAPTASRKMVGTLRWQCWVELHSSPACWAQAEPRENPYPLTALAPCLYCVQILGQATNMA